MSRFTADCGLGTGWRVADRLRSNATVESEHPAEPLGALDCADRKATAILGS